MSEIQEYIDSADYLDLDWIDNVEVRVLRDAEAEITALRRWILDAEHSGHRDYCSAVKGPDNENWYVHEECDCGRKALLGADDE